MLAAVYWNARTTPLEEAASLLVAACRSLAQAGYTSLRYKGRSRKEVRAFISDSESAASLLIRGVNHRDIDKTAMPELGFSFGLWSGGTEESAYEFTGQIGNTTNIGSNSLMLRLPARGPLSYEGNETRVLALFRELVSMSNADQGVICEPQDISWVGGRLSPAIPSKAKHQ